MENDRLFEIFHRLLGHTQDPNETAAQLIRRAAHAYAVELFAKGEIPLAFREDVMDDLEAELLIAYRKVTYGFFSLAEYRESRAKKKKTKSAS